MESFFLNKRAFSVRMSDVTLHKHQVILHKLRNQAIPLINIFTLSYSTMLKMAV
jgi:hypothetical protein